MDFLYGALTVMERSWGVITFINLHSTFDKAMEFRKISLGLGKNHEIQLVVLPKVFSADGLLGHFGPCFHLSFGQPLLMWRSLQYNTLLTLPWWGF